MSDSAKKYTIAVIPGDGIGKEVTPWAQKALEKAAEGVAEFEYEHFDLGAERYLRDARSSPRRKRTVSRRPMRFCWAPSATRVSRPASWNAACCSSSASTWTST